jgi:hypothetical protein
MIDHNSRAIELESPTISPKKDIKKPAKDAGSLDVYLMVPEAGLEPARPCDRQILNLLCLPISPLGQSAFTSVVKEKVEARSGVEPD